jgi:AhpD family alkylhydroperoxidase
MLNQTFYAMEQRMNAFDKGNKGIKALFSLGTHVRNSSIEQSLQDLIDFRVSQINGCAFCLDMHSKDLRAHGESEQRLYLLSAWREASCYSGRERAALAWSEAVTNLPDRNVPDEIYNQAREQFSEVELIDLTLTVITVNSYNRLNIAFRTPAGDYVPGQFASVSN